MAFVFNLPAVLVSVLLPPLVVGLAGGALARRWRPARPLAALLIALFGAWAADEFLWPWGMLPEAGPYRIHILLGIVGGALIGIALLHWLSRAQRSRPAA